MHELEVSTRLKGMSGLCTSTTTKPQEKTQKGKQKKNKIGESAFSQTADVKTSFRILTSPKPQLLTTQNWGGEEGREEQRKKGFALSLLHISLPFVKSCLSLCVVRPNGTSKSK